MALVSKPHQSKLKSMLKRQKPRKLGKKYGCVNRWNESTRVSASLPSAVVASDYMQEEQEDRF
jgi:hypothetical protein